MGCIDDSWTENYTDEELERQPIDPLQAEFFEDAPAMFLLTVMNNLGCASQYKDSLAGKILNYLVGDNQDRFDDAWEVWKSFLGSQPVGFVAPRDEVVEALRPYIVFDLD